MNNTDRVGFAGFFIACLFFAFLGGSYLMLAQIFPYPYFNDAYKAGWALVEQQNDVSNPFTQTDQWRQARSDHKGVTIYDPDRADNGYTLYTSGDDPYAALIDMRGHVVHRWQLDYSKVWQTTPDGREPRSDDLIYWRKAIMYPNGDLLAIYIAAAETPWGYGMVKLDADSNVIWKYHGATHHDFDIAPDGRIIALTHAFSNRKFTRFPNLSQPYIDDFVVALDGQTGKPLTKVSVFDAFINSRYAQLLLADPSFAMEDPLHTNSIQFIDAELAGQFGPASGHGNQVLVSTRHPGTALLISLDTKDVTWGLRGPWLGQHSINALPNGHFEVFDNYGHFQEGNMTRIIEMDPASNAITWRYTGTRAQRFESLLRGQISTLDNGNRLITESDGGRLFEITPDHDIVWEFVNPVRGGNQNQFIPVVSSGQRIKPGALSPAFRQSLKSE